MSTNFVKTTPKQLTVGDLIKILSKLDHNKDVFCAGFDGPDLKDPTKHLCVDPLFYAIEFQEGVKLYWMI